MSECVATIGFLSWQQVFLQQVFDKTIADIPCVCEIFEVSQSLGALFGVGDGRVILRGAADQIGARRSRVPDQGGSRKVIALANTIEHLLNNQKTFHAAIAQSESLKQEGRKHHGRQSIIDEREIKNRLFQFASSRSC